VAVAVVIPDTRCMDNDQEVPFNWVVVVFQLKEAAVEAVNPHLFTVATLTGHAYLAVGEGYSIGKKHKQ
jgi:leucyl aminopeptidase